MSDEQRADPAAVPGVAVDPLANGGYSTTGGMAGALDGGQVAGRRTTQIDDLLVEQQELDRKLNAPDVSGRQQRAEADDEVLDGVEAAPARQPRKKRRMNPLLEWLIVVAVAITSALLVRAYVVQQFAVEGESMMSTLHNGDRVLVNRLSYRLHDPRRGDVVVLRKIEGATAERDLIKRVIGLPGETVEVKSCIVYINDVPLDEPYLDPLIQARDGCGQDQSTTVVPPGEVFVLGDHRGKSSDSRLFGAVNYGDLIGRAFVIIWPVGDWAWL
jgi:signal peptidase I